MRHTVAQISPEKLPPPGIAPEILATASGRPIRRLHCLGPGTELEDTGLSQCKCLSFCILHSPARASSYIYIHRQLLSKTLQKISYVLSGALKESTMYNFLGPRSLFLRLQYLS